MKSCMSSDMDTLMSAPKLSIASFTMLNASLPVPSSPLVVFALAARFCDDEYTGRMRA